MLPLWQKHLLSDALASLFCKWQKMSPGKKCPRGQFEWRTLSRQGLQAGPRHLALTKLQWSKSSRLGKRLVDLQLYTPITALSSTYIYRSTILRAIHLYQGHFVWCSRTKALAVQTTTILKLQCHCMSLYHHQTGVLPQATSTPQSIWYWSTGTRHGFHCNRDGRYPIWEWRKQEG